MLSGLRRGLVALPRGVNKGFKNNMNIITRSMAIDLSKKEQGEETIYIRKMEAARKQLLEEKMAEILERHHSDEEHQALVNLLDKKEKKVDPREVGMLQYLGFDDWRWAFPCAAVIGVPMVTLDVLVIDYKMYLVAVFAMMWHAYGATLLPIWSEKSDWVGEYVRDAWSTFDKDAVQQLNQDIKVNEEFLQSRAVFEDIFASVDDVAVAQAAALNLENKNEFHRAIQKKLDALAALNESTTSNIRQDMIETVKSEVAQSLYTDASVQEDALDMAIEALYQGRRGRDVVGEVYLGAISNYRDSLAQPNHPVHAIAEHMQAEIADIVEAPQVIKKAGNVYETHPVL